MQDASITEFGLLPAHIDFKGELVPIERRFDSMLWTRRKDKAGKDIYENDIIKTNEGNVYFVRYEGGSYLLISTKSSYYQYLSGFTDNLLQVIGDTYRNPELLKKD